MKRFLSQILATILGIIIFLGILLAFIIAGISSSNKTKKIELKEGSILEITLEKPLYESPDEGTVSISKIGEDRLYFKDILDIIKIAKKDEKIRGMTLKLNKSNASYAQITELRDIIKDFKTSGKFVFSYDNGNSQKMYYLSTIADSLFVNPNATIELMGLSSEVMFFKNFGDKYGIDFEIIRHGKYKSAVEPFFRTNLSEENKTQLKELHSDVWAKIVSDITESRNMDSAHFNKAVDSLWAAIPELGIQNRLVDKMVYESQYDEILKNKVNTDKLYKLSLSEYYSSLSNPGTKPQKIAILYASGEIKDGTGVDGIYSERIIKDIKEISKDENIKAVVLRVNSPGGSASASDNILYELKEMKNQKPLVVSFSGYAASGGYYISMVADKIYAQENTITGSIGVFGLLPNVKKLASNIGINTEYVGTNANSLPYSPLQGASKGMLDIANKSVEQTYSKFVGVVMSNRKKTFEQIDSLGGGRVWSGKAALKSGLVDEIGGIDSAIVYAAKLAKIQDYSLESYPRRKNVIEELQEALKGYSISENIIKQELGEDYKTYKNFKEKIKSKGAMYMMPYDIKIE